MVDFRGPGHIYSWRKYWHSFISYNITYILSELLSKTFNALLTLRWEITNLTDIVKFHPVLYIRLSIIYICLQHGHQGYLHSDHMLLTANHQIPKEQTKYVTICMLCVCVCACVCACVRACVCVCICVA